MQTKSYWGLLWPVWIRKLSKIKIARKEIGTLDCPDSCVRNLSSRYVSKNLLVSLFLFSFSFVFRIFAWLLPKKVLKNCHCFHLQLILAVIYQQCRKGWSNKTCRFPKVVCIKIAAQRELIGFLKLNSGHILNSEF